MQIKNIRELVDKVNTSQEVREEIKRDPQEFFKRLTVMNDKFVFLKVLYIVGTVLGVSLLAIIVFIFLRPDTEIPQILVFFGSTSLGALVGLLVPNR